MTQSLHARLIQGAFICPVTDAPSYERLRDDPSFRSSISEWLEQAGFQLNETSSGSAFFSGIRHAIPREHGTEIISQFKRAYEANAFVRHFMDSLRAAADASIEFKSGELLRSAELFKAIVASDARLARLRKLWTRLGKKNNIVNDHQKLIDGLERLATEGYVVLESKELGTYRICGKIEHMFDLIEYAMSKANEEQTEEFSDEEGLSEADDAEPGQSARTIGENIHGS